MNIQFTSTLTADDENRLAPIILKSVSGILDLLPIAYAIRIETPDAHVYQHSRPATRPNTNGSSKPKAVPGSPVRSED